MFKIQEVKGRPWRSTGTESSSATAVESPNERGNDGEGREANRTRLQSTQGSWTLFQGQWVIIERFYAGESYDVFCNNHLAISWRRTTRGW